MAHHPVPRVLRRLAIAAFAIAVALVPFSAQAADAIGEAVKVRGEAHVARGGADLPLKPGTALLLHDTVMTGPGARAQIRFVDGSTITLAENSGVAIDRYAVNAAAGQRKVLLSALSGVLNAVATKGGEANFDYRIKTGNGYSAVRGTNWIVALLDAATAVYVVEGLVEVGTESGARAVVAAGNAVTLGAGGIGQAAPTPPDVLRQLLDATDVASAAAAPEAPAAAPAPAEQAAPDEDSPAPAKAPREKSGGGGGGHSGGGMH